MRLRTSPTTIAPYALFFLSGISGLVYQVVWVRQFGNVFGNTVHSAALVTAVFMLGLGVGSYLAGAWADRRHARGPGPLLAAYGGAEVAIGLLGVALALILPRLGALSALVSSYTRDARGWSELSTGAELLRYAVAALLLAPMTLLMGGTLTLLIRHQVGGDLPRAGIRIGVLYGLNTAGAALGAFLTDFALVPGLGLLRTQIASAAVNVTVGVAAIALATRFAEPAAATAAPEDDDTPAADAPPGEEGSPHAVALTAAAIALTGLAGMGLEIVWFRFLAGALSQYRAVFSLLLAVILLGMWAGSTLGGYLARRFGRPATSYVVVEVLFVLATLALLAAFDKTAVDRYLTSAFRGLGSPESGLPRGAQCWAMVRVIAGLVGLPSLLMGCAFPLANANVQRVAARVGRRAGVLYLANTAGSVLGSLLAGFLLLPRLGAQGSVLVLAAAASLAIVPLHLSTRRGLADDRPLGGADYVFAGGFLVLALTLSTWGMLLPEGTLRGKSLPDPLGERFLDVSEGPNEVLAVSVGPDGSRRLWTNGHPMSATTPDCQRYMRAFAHVPLLTMEAPKSALVICFGVGNTLNAASLHPSVERLDVADLSRNVLDHAGFFAASNGGVLGDPRVHVYVNDGRQHLRMVPEGTYDLVTLEPPPISHAGVAALYSREFYELVRSRLTPGGILTQWLPVQQLQGPEVLALVRAFVDVFPQAVLLSGERHDLILMGSAGAPVVLDPAAVERRLRDRPLVAADLEGISLRSPADLAGTFVASAEVLRRVTQAAAPVTDDAPSMEYSVLSKFVSVRVPPELFDTGGVTAFCPGCAGVPDLDGHLRVLGRLYGSPVFLHQRSFAVVPVEIGLPALLGDDGSGAMAAAIAHSGYLQRIVGIDPHGLGMSLRPGQLDALQAFVAAHPEQALPELRLGLAHLAAGRFEAAVETLGRAVALAPELVAARFGLAAALGRVRRFDEAIAEYRRALEMAPRDVPGRAGLLDTLVVAGRGEEVAGEAARLLAIDPDNGAAHRSLCLMHLAQGAVTEARTECQRAVDGGAAVDARIMAHLFGR